MSAATKILGIEQAINLCQAPQDTQYNILPAILKVIVTKLNLGDTVLSVPLAFSTETQPSNIAKMDVYNVLKGGEQKPIDAKSVKLKPATTPKNDVHTLVQNANIHATPSVHDEKIPLFSPRKLEHFTDPKLTSMEKHIEKIGILLQKMVEQYENLAKRVQMLISRCMCQPDNQSLNFPVSQNEMNFPVSMDFKLPNKPSEYTLPYSKSDINDITIGVRKEDIENLREEFKNNFCELARKILKMGEKLKELEDNAAKRDYLKKVLDQITPKEQVDTLREKVEFTCCQITKFRKEVSCLRSQFQDVSECTRFTDKRIKEIEKKLETLKKIRDLCDQMEKFDLWKKKINEELEKFTEITEYLKTTKADREELDYLFTEKADRDELLKLVTLEFFKSVQDDLSSGIVQVLEQLMRNEIEWERAHKEIQLMMDVKADSCEVTSLKRYINCKLEIIQKKLNDLIRNKLTAHAAAVRIRLLQDARCITCTADADINQLKYPVPFLYPVKRREGKCICEPSKRYCGGSHTVLGPNQKLIVKRKLPLMTSAVTTLDFNYTKGANANLFRTRKQKCICEKQETPKQTDDKEKKKSLFPC